MLIKLFVFSLLCYGFSNIIVFSHLFDKPRDFFYKKSNKSKFYKKIYELITCMMCMPTWIGFLISIIDILVGNNINLTPINSFLSNIDYPNYFIPFIILFDGIISSGITWLIHTLQEFLEKK